MVHAELNRKKRKREDLNPEAQGKPAGDMSLNEGEAPVESQSRLAGTSQLLCYQVWYQNASMSVSCMQLPLGSKSLPASYLV